MKILKALRDEHNAAIIRALQSIGICIDYNDVEKQFEECIVTRMNFARTLVKKDMQQQKGRHLQNIFTKAAVRMLNVNIHHFQL